MEIIQETGQSRDPEGPEPEVDLFKASFKKFKLSKNPERDFLPQNEATSEARKTAEIAVREILVDPTTGLTPGREEDPQDWDKLLQKRCLDCKTDDAGTADRAKNLGLRHPSTWNVFDVKFPKGLILIRNPFTPEGQRHWIRRSVTDYPFQSSHITNIDNLENKEGKSIKEKLDREEGFFKTLRWVTFGYHHNWDTKVYSEDSKCEFPPDLANLTKFMADMLGFLDFKAEAAIANYYHLDSTLSGHVDRSEEYQNAPLFSLSFGQPAVFLIGGRTKAVKPQAIILQSGDIAVMSGESRLSFHGVPKIFQTKDEPWTLATATTTILPNGQPINKRPKLDVVDTHPDSLNVEWSCFLSSYVRKSRINLNIRQVLFPGQNILAESHS